MEGNLPAYLFSTVLGVLLVVSGILAYTGKYRAWLMLKSFLSGWPGLAGGYIGVMILLALYLPLIGESLPPILFLLAAAFTFLSMAIGIIGMFWLPSFLLPAWIKETRDRMKRGEDELSQALKPGGTLHGRLGVDTKHTDWNEMKKKPWKPRGGKE
ncbi:hypothetical protein F7P69_13255 [Cellulosimicrobium funkei]|nr:hypothetical protein [Cellulosimicrobium funkei]